VKILADTNVLVRSVERKHPLLRTARNALRHLYEQSHELHVATQNISEFWNVCTRPVNANGLGNSVDATARLISRLETFFAILPESMETFRHWRRLVVAHGVKGAKVHDARLAATVLAYRLDSILTLTLATLLDSRSRRLIPRGFD
jgi:predicted nucleic acid-binding protein